MHHRAVRRFAVVVVLFALSSTRSARAQVSDADLAAHMDATAEFHACLEKRYAAMREAMAIADVDARNATMRTIPLCVEPPPLRQLPAPASGSFAPPALTTAGSPRPAFVPVSPFAVRKSYRHWIVLADLGALTLTGLAMRAEPRLGFAGAAVWVAASPAIHYRFGAKGSAAISLVIRGAGAALAIHEVLAFEVDECEPDDLFCIGPAVKAAGDAMILSLAISSGVAVITAIDAGWLAKPYNVYITPTYTASQGTAGIALGGTF